MKPSARTAQERFDQAHRQHGTAVCRLAHCRAVLEYVTDSLGRVAEHCPMCARRRRGICRDCPARVEGQIGKAMRCARCKRAAWNASRRRGWKDPAIRRRRTARFKKYSQRPEVRARRKKDHAAWRKANPATVKRHKRAFLLRDGPARRNYLALQARHNRNPIRAQRKRDAAIAKYYERHPVRPDPHCTGCGVALAWTPGHGRPRATCDRCCAPAELRRRQRGDNVKRERVA